MSTHLTSATVRIAIARARTALQRVGAEGIEKTIWGSPAGKKKLARRLVALLPPHRVYCEPFAGSAAVLFAKEPAEVEAINDADPEIADAYRTIQKLTPADIERLRGMTWVGDERTFKRLFDAGPKDPVEKLYRFLYVSHFSYGKLRSRSFSPSQQGVEATTVSRIEAFAPRLKGVKVHGEDYQGVIEKYDSPDTVFFLDPPYPGYNVDVGESSFDEHRFFELLTSIKGRWLLTYSSRYADLLFEVVTRRYDAHRPILLSTNKAFNDWAEVFPHATCTVTLVDRLVHRSEILEIDADSYRLKEAKERQATRSASRRGKKPKR